MSAEDIIEEMEKKGREELNRISADCEKNLKGIIEENQRKLEELKATMSKKLEESLKRIEITSNDEIVIARKTIEMDRKQKLIEEFWEMVGGLEPDIRKDPKYEDFIRDSIKEATSKLGKGVTVIGSSEDKTLISKVNGNFTFKEANKAQLGILAISSDGKRTINMTFNSIMADQKNRTEEKIMGKIGAD